MSCGKNINPTSTPATPTAVPATASPTATYCPTITFTPTPTPPAYTFSTFFGNTASVSMNHPEGVAVSGSTLWVSNTGAANLQAWTTGGSLITTITSGISNPYAAAVGPDGYIYVLCNGSDQVSEFSPAGLGSYVTNFGNAQLTGTPCTGVAVGTKYAYASSGSTIFGYPITGSGASKTFGSPISFGYAIGPGQLGTNFYLCVDNNQNVDVADYYNHRIVQFSQAGVYQTAVTLTSGGEPSSAAVDGLGYIYVLDSFNGEIQQFTSAGTFVTAFGQSNMTGMAGFLGQLAIDLGGNIYVSDYPASQVLVFARNQTRFWQRSKRFSRYGFSMPGSR